MTEFILCCAMGCMLVWVYYLKLEISVMQTQQERLKQLLERHLEKTKDVEVADEARVWGKKVRVPEMDVSWIQRRPTVVAAPADRG